MTAFDTAAGAPIIDAAQLVERVRADFDLSLSSTSQVFGGQDSEVVVCRGVTGDGATVAVKVSRSACVNGLLVSSALAAGGWPGIPAPLLSRSGQPYSRFGGATLSVTPWVAGRAAFAAGLRPDQWRDFGRLMAQIHAAPLRSPERDELAVEDYRTPAAALARRIDARIRAEQLPRGPHPPESPADALVEEWRAAGESIALILDRIDGLGEQLRAKPTSLVVTHGDAHLGNLLLDEHGALWLLDWDEVALAPRERDLMFIIGGVLSDVPVTSEQQDWFFQGYGGAEIDPARLAYYRCSWAVQDLADFAARILDQPDRPAASEQALGFIRGILSPTGIVHLARSSLQEG